MWGQELGMETYEQQGENFEFGELSGEMSGETIGEMPLNEAYEMELASELLSVSSEAELEQFLGGLIKKVGGFMKGPVGKALGGALKGIAKKALPMVGGALGSFVAPGVGTAIGSQLGSAAGKLFGLELEGLSSEDREFEVARRVVRLTSSAAQKAAQAPPHIPPHVVAKKAVLMAARKHAPGLVTACPVCAAGAAAPPAQSLADTWTGLQPAAPAASWGGSSLSGRWIRRGGKIILFGV
jgi:uncharacterized protein (DUF697 family)